MRDRQPGAERPGRDPGRPVYVISVAAELVRVHPRTLRIYEVEGLIAPARTRTNIRLYSEKDFLERPRFTQPEIQRANLADVILRLKAFGLGDIERFPFINPPATKAIRAGYALLEELGALGEPKTTDTTHTLTTIGRELARLPARGEREATRRGRRAGRRHVRCRRAPAGLDSS